MRIKNHLNRLHFPSLSFSLPPFLPTNRFPFSSISLFSMVENSINHFQYVYIKLLIWVNGDAGDVCWPPGLGWNNIYFSLRENALSSSKKVVANFNRFPNEQKMREIFEIEARKRSPQHTHTNTWRLAKSLVKYCEHTKRVWNIGPIGFAVFAASVDRSFVVYCKCVIIHSNDGKKDKWKKQMTVCVCVCRAMDIASVTK